MTEQGEIRIGRSEEVFRERYALCTERIRESGSGGGAAAPYFEALKNEDPGQMLAFAGELPGRLPVLLSAFAREYAALPAFRAEQRTEACCILMETAIQLDVAFSDPDPSPKTEKEVQEILYSYLFDYCPLFFEDAAAYGEESFRSPGEPFPRRLLLRFVLAQCLLAGGFPQGKDICLHEEDLAPFYGSRLAARIAECAEPYLENGTAKRAFFRALGRLAESAEQPGPPAGRQGPALTPGQRGLALSAAKRMLERAGIPYGGF